MESEPLDITMLINKAHPLPEDFRPDGLIDLYSLEERRFFLPPKPMLLYAEAAKAVNWRSREEQTLIYRHRRREGYVALPGCSEHESGLCVDIDSLDSQEMQLYWEWLKRNSWRFGYVLRYPKDREHITGIGYEPWHFRYVGENLAAILHEKNWTREEYFACCAPAGKPDA